MSDLRKDTRNWYSEYYLKNGQDRNNIRTNPEVLFQTLANEASVVNVARKAALPLEGVSVLDVGCGAGGNFFQLLRLGVCPDKLSGIDILQENIEHARLLFPQVKLVCADAGSMPFEDEKFDLVSEFTMFATLPDETLAAKIAFEMLRVCRSGGYLLLVDWRTPKPGDHNYSALNMARLERLFGLGSSTELVAISNGALIPPLGRFLSKYLPSMYFPVSAVFPFLVGQVAYLLRKRVA